MLAERGDRAECLRLARHDSGGGQQGQGPPPEGGGQDGEQSADGQAGGEDPMGPQDEGSGEMPQDGQGQPGEEAGAMSAAEGPDETQQATEQWLRRIPDDPGGLLRRKFLYQHRQRGREAEPGAERW